MVRWFMAALFCCSAALTCGVAGCHEEFSAPDKPDLYKTPHDFGFDLAVEQPGVDLAVEQPKDHGLPIDLMLPDQAN